MTAAIIASNQGRFDATIEILSPAIERNQSGEFAERIFIALRVEAYLKAGRYNDAIADLKRYLPTNPAEPGPYQALADAYHRAGRDKEALQFVDRAIVHAGGDEVYNLCAAIDENLGHRDDAIADYRSALKIGLNYSTKKTAWEALARLGATP
jgi:tetratricopeptide (TPR) repeat protein